MDKDKQQTKMIEDEQLRTLYEGLLNQTQCILMVLDDTGIIQFINEKGCSFLEGRKDEIIGKNWNKEFLREEEQKKLKKIFNEIVTSKKSTSQTILSHIAKKKSVEAHHNTNKIITLKKNTKLVAWTCSRIELGDGRVFILSSGQDIEQEQRSQTAINQFTEITTQSPLGVAITDAQGDIVYVNPAFSDITGYSEKEVIGKNPRILKSGLQDDDFYKNMWIKISAGEVWKGTFINKKKNGAMYHEEATIFPIKDEEGNIINYSAIKEDISARVRTEEEILRDKQLLELYFSQSLTGIFFSQLDSPIQWKKNSVNKGLIDYTFKHLKMTKVNTALLEQYRATKNELIGISPSTLFAADKNMGRAFFQELFDKGKLHRETYERRLDGSYMWLIGDYTCLYDDHGKIMSVFGSQTDITEQKRAERQLKESEERKTSLINSMDDLVFVLDKNMVFKEYEQPLNSELYSTPEEFVGKKLRETALPTQVKKVLSKAIHTVMQTGKSSSAQYSLELPSGTAWFDCNISMYKNSKGEIEGVTGVVRDITEQKRNQEELSKREEQLSNIFQTIPDGILVKTLEDDTFIMVNNAFCIMTGYKAQEVIGKTSSDFCVFTHKEDKEELLRRMKNEGIVNDMEAEYKCKKSISEKKSRNGLFSANTFMMNNKHHAILLIKDYEEIRQYQVAQEQNNEELHKKNEELEKINTFMVDRELRMIELKKEVNDLLTRLGEHKKYKKTNDQHSQPQKLNPS